MTVPLPRIRGTAWVAVLAGALIALPLVVPAASAADGPLASLPGAGEASEPVARALPTPPSTPRASRRTIETLIERYAKRYGLEPSLVHAVVRAESNYDPHAVSPAGAVGLMQVMPATGADYGVESVEALFDAQTNVRVGTRHLKRLVNRYGIGKAVMAYNAGEGALERQNGFVTFPETQRYTHRVLSQYLRHKGIGLYSLEARKLTGIQLTPAMASAGGAAGGRGGRLLRRVDLSTLSLRVRPSLSDRALDPSVLRAGPESKPMFVLERPTAVD